MEASTKGRTARWCSPEPRGRFWAGAPTQAGSRTRRLWKIHQAPASISVSEETLTQPSTWERRARRRQQKRLVEGWRSGGASEQRSSPCTAVVLGKWEPPDGSFQALINQPQLPVLVQLPEVWSSPSRGTPTRHKEAGGWEGRQVVMVTHELLLNASLYVEAERAWRRLQRDKEHGSSKSSKVSSRTSCSEGTCRRHAGQDGVGSRSCRPPPWTRVPWLKRRRVRRGRGPKPPRVLVGSFNPQAEGT